MTGAVTELVWRKATEHFEASDLERVRLALSTIEDARVGLAAIKLADGDVESLERYVLLARIDWRDVVGPAEYPRYLAAGPQAAHRSDAAALEALDRQEYEDWLGRPGPHVVRGGR